MEIIIKHTPPTRIEGKWTEKRSVGSRLSHLFLKGLFCAFSPWLFFLLIFKNKLIKKKIPGTPRIPTKRCGPSSRSDAFTLSSSFLLFSSFFFVFCRRQEEIPLVREDKRRRQRMAFQAVFPCLFKFEYRTGSIEQSFKMPIKCTAPYCSRGFSSKKLFLLLSGSLRFLGIQFCSLVFLLL